MAISDADEALHFILDVLASHPGSVQHRLREAWARHGQKLKAEDLPEDNREDLQFIEEAVADAAALGDEEASNVASAIAVLRSEVAFAFGKVAEREYPMPTVTV